MDKLFTEIEANDRRLSEGRSRGGDEKSLEEYSDHSRTLLHLLEDSVDSDDDPINYFYDLHISSFLYSAESVGADRTLSSIILTAALSDHLDDLIDLIYANRSSYRSHFYNPLREDHINKLLWGRQLLERFRFLLKAAFLGIGVSSGMSVLYEDSSKLCLTCSDQLQEDEDVVLEYCKHAICIRCVDLYKIDHPRCIFGCGEDEKIRTKKRYDDNEDPLQDLTENEKDDLVSCMKEYLKNLANMSKEVIKKYKEHNVLLEDLCKESANYLELEEELINYLYDYKRFNLYTMFPLSYEILKCKCRISTIGCKEAGVVRFQEESMNVGSGVHRRIYRSLNMLKMYLDSPIMLLGHVQDLNEGKIDELNVVKSIIGDSQVKVRKHLLRCVCNMRDFVNLNLCGFEEERLQLIEAFEGYFHECPEDNEEDDEESDEANDDEDFGE